MTSSLLRLQRIAGHIRFRPPTPSLNANTSPNFRSAFGFGFRLLHTARMAAAAASTNDNKAAGAAAAGAAAAKPKAGESYEYCTVAAGCFWSVELAFQRVNGVLGTEVGYTNGTVANPTYEQVCSGSSGHAEAVRVTFDPAVVTYEQLLQVFWKKHDPTTLNRQGNDRGTQYRSGIYTHSDAQAKAAAASKEAEQKKLGSGKSIVTEIAPAGPWYKAEEYHQRYLEKDGQSAAKGCSDYIHCYGKPKKGFWG